ncbi:MAG: YfhO family protein [Bacteroidetes bacterium]|nr:YfhO family protein [Bacteroidota bacterium]
MAKKEKLKQLQEKKNFDIKDWHAIAFIVAAVIVFFRDLLLMKAFMWEDFLYQFYPFRNFAAVSISNGELPLWNPYTFNGMPFQADIQSALFYIPNLILTIFVSSDRLHFYWVELFVILHYMIAGITMYYLMRHFKLDRLIALFSALVYTLSGFMITHGIHQIIINHVSWLPLIFLLFKKALEEKSLLFTILGGLVLGHSVLAGFPQLSLYIFLLLFFYFIFEFGWTIKTPGIKHAIPIVPYAACFVIIAIALTAIQMLPTLELAPQSARAEITYEKSQEGTLAPQQIITLLIPKFFGEHSAVENNYWGPGAYWQYWETNIYIGIAALILVVIALTLAFKNKIIGFFSFILLFGFLYALGDYFILHKFFFFNIPGFHLFRNPGRMSLWFSFAAAILSGFGLRELLTYNKNRLKIVLIVILSTSVLIWILVQTGLFQTYPNQEFLLQIREIATSNANIFIAFAIVISALIFIFYLSKISSFVLIGLLILIQFIDQNIFGFSFNNGKVSPTEYYKSTEQLVNYLKEEGKKEYFRINSRKGRNMILDRNQGMVDKIFMMEGYTPLSLQRIYPPAETWDKVCDLLNAKYRIEVDEAARSMRLKTSNTYLPRSYFVYDYRVITDENSIKAYMSSQEFNPRQTVILEEDPKITGDRQNDWSSWKANIASYNLNSIYLDVSTPKDGILVLSEIYYPGWNAFIDGVKHKVLRSNWNLRAVPVKQGNHKVQIKFEPESFKRGSFITLSSIGLCAIGIVYSLYKKKKKATT